MGQLEASCFAQGSDNTLYALAYGHDLSITSGDNAVAALLKSNASPSSPNALTWQVVSTIREGDLFSFGDGTEIQCLADPNGAFLAWSYSAYRPGQNPTAQSRPGGFRYDPSLSTSSVTTTGKGGWVNVETPINYSWASASAAGDLFYLKDGSGKYNFYHVFTSGSMGTTFNFGALNTATTPNMMENSAIKWSVRSTITDYVDGMKTTATKLSVWGVAAGSGNLFGVADLPQSGPLPTTAPSLHLGNYTTPISCSYPGALGDKVYKYCRISQIHGEEYKLFAWDGSNALDPIGMSRLPVKDMHTRAIAGIFGDSSTTYMLVQSGRLVPQYGASGFGNYLLKALALTGAAAGSVLDVPNNITVQDNIAFYGSAAGGALKTSTGLSTFMSSVIGVVGPLVGLCIVIKCVRAHRERKVVTVGKDPAMLVVQTFATTHVTRV